MAFEWFQKAVSNTETPSSKAYAYYCLGICYYNGHGVGQDYKRSVDLFTESAREGNTQAELQLGVCYYYGNGVSRDFDLAFNFLKGASMTEYASTEVYSLLSKCYRNGFGTKRNIKEADRWLKKAADNNDADAIAVLRKISEIK